MELDKKIEAEIKHGCFESILRHLYDLGKEECVCAADLKEYEEWLNFCSRPFVGSYIVAFADKSELDAGKDVVLIGECKYANRSLYGDFFYCTKDNKKNLHYEYCDTIRITVRRWDKINVVTKEQYIKYIAILGTDKLKSVRYRQLIKNIDNQLRGFSNPRAIYIEAYSFAGTEKELNLIIAERSGWRVPALSIDKGTPLYEPVAKVINELLPDKPSVTLDNAKLLYEVYGAIVNVLTKKRNKYAAKLQELNNSLKTL